MSAHVYRQERARARHICKHAHRNRSPSSPSHLSHISLSLSSSSEIPNPLFSLRPGTKVYLAATAGLRALPNRGDIDGIISSVQSYLQEYYSPQLVWAERYPRVLSGNEEGVFGWAAVNHMLGQLGSPDQTKTVGTLDLGGSSTQITFVAHDEEDIPDGYKFILPFKGQMYHLYTHSFAGYGYNDAHSSILQESEKVSGNTGGGSDTASTMTTLIDPCTLSGYTADLEVDGQKVALSGTGSWGDCTTRCKLLLSRGWPCVSIPGGTGVVTSTGNRRGAGDVSARGSVTASCGGVGASGDTAQSKVLFVEPISKSFYALSNFRDIERALGFDDVATVGQMATTGRDLCHTPWHKVLKDHPDLEEKALSTYCFGASYVYSILHDGYHFPDDLKVHFAKRIDVPGMDKVKISWTRGMILYETLNSGVTYASTGSLGSSDTVGASDSGDGDSSFVANVLLVGMFAAAITMAAGIALVRSPTLKDRLSEGMTRGMEKGAEASEWAGEAAESAARAGKRLATSLPGELPFDVPSVFRKAAHKGGYGEMSEDGGAGAGLKGGVAMKDYGSIEDGRSGGKDPTQERSWGRAFVRVFPQLARGGTGEEREPIAARGASGLSNVEVVADNFKPEGAGAGAVGGDTDEGGNMCMVCEGRRKNGVVGKCGLCMARKDEDKD